jgi:hypothetical protein
LLFKQKIIQKPLNLIEDFLMVKSYISKINLIVKVLTLVLVFSFSKSWGQAALPLSRTAWAAEPTGWTNSGCSQRTSVFACSGSDGTTFDTNGDSRTVFFSSSPDQLVFKLKSSSMSGASSLLVQESADGSTWSNIGTYGTAGGATAIVDCGNITITLNCLSRYIRWTYTKATGNCDMDDVSISSFSGSCGSCTTPTTPPAPTAAANPACSIATLSVGSSTVAGVTWYWQTSSSGTSTTQPTSSSYTTSSSTSTVYVRAQDNTGLCWSAASSSLVVTVNTPPSVTTQPTNKTVCAGSGTTFSIVASGTSPSYQWQVNDGLGGGYVNVSTGLYTGGTTAILTLTNSTSSMSSYSYQCVASVAACSTTTSNPGILIVVSIPAIPPVPTTSLSNPSCGSNTVVAMTSTVAGVTWYWEATSASVSTANSTTTQTVIASTSTVYAKAISNVGACASSASSLVVTINTAIAISSCPASSVICEGAGTTVKFTVSASGGSPYTNGWQVNSGSGYTTITDNATYSGSAAQTLTINTTALSVGVYSFQPLVTNACGTASCVTTLTVVSIPAAPPTPSIIATCNTAVISETVVGTPPAGVTWYWASNAAAPVSYTSAVNDYSATSSGTVYIRAKSDMGTCWNTTGTTNSVVVTVIKSPTITTQPTSSIICQGTSASFKVTMSASSTSPLTYQWQENTGSGFANISSGSPYTISVGTYTSTLDIDGTKPLGTYTYQCIISNSCGTATSSIVTVTITTLPTNDLCSNASPIAIDAASVTGNLNCAGPTAGLTYVPSKNDVWYAFTPTCTATHTVTMTFTQTGGLDYDLDVFTTGSCPASGTATYTSHGTSTVETIAQSFTSGVTYYVRVIDYNTSGGTFSIGVVSNCGTSHTVIFDSNGGAGSMSNQTANSATNLTNNAFTNSGCSFVNWNDSANANGTFYANNAVYSFTADVTLYAQWNCSSGGGSAGCPYLVSAVVNACSGTCNAEGKNEIVVMNSGNYAIPVNGSSINLYYSGGTNHYFTGSFAASSGTVVSNLNTLVATGGCTNTPFTFVSSGGTVPANSTFMILNNNSCFSGDFSAYCNAGPIYVIISTDVDWFSGGYFGNNSTPRYFRTDFSNVNSGCGLTTYNYNNPSTFAFNNDGASVTFNGTTASYITGNGSCAPNVAILPIELVDFYATKNGKKNDIVWKVASEENIVYYTIDKSNDGVNFMELATVFSNNATQRKTYSVVDDTPFDDITYYRLGTKENDGKVYYHKIISIDEKSSDWNIIHFQQEQNLIIEFKNTVPKNSTIHLFDLSGKQLAEVVVKESQTKINTQAFAQGIYFMKISTPYKTENFKLIISK